MDSPEGVQGFWVAMLRVVLEGSRVVVSRLATPPLCEPGQSPNLSEPQSPCQ